MKKLILLVTLVSVYNYVQSEETLQIPENTVNQLIGQPASPFYIRFQCNATYAPVSTIANSIVLGTVSNPNFLPMTSNIVGNKRNLIGGRASEFCTVYLVPATT